MASGDCTDAYHYANSGTLLNSATGSTVNSSFWIRPQWIETNGTSYWAWGDQTANSITMGSTLNISYRPIPLQQVTPEQIHQAAEARAKREAEEALRAAKRTEASKRGKLLLKDVIGDVLFEKLEKNRYVDIPSKLKPEYAYRLRYNRQIGLLKRVSDTGWKEVQEHLCIHPTVSHVEADDLATHAILCLFDEKKLWSEANHHRVGIAA